ncbi:hypothetical protein [Teichococcus aestuarii]|uniref:hypothetical protein n=1 Tax=Teichococcus aestuarii TaxID=568898 RepID=UPI003608AC12
MPEQQPRQRPVPASPAASARVETVKDRPSACTMSSRPSPSAPRKGTAGMTNTPVAPVTAPVASPTSGAAQGSARSGTRSAGRAGPRTA